jgi:O-antigen ligase
VTEQLLARTSVRPPFAALMLASGLLLGIGTLSAGPFVGVVLGMSPVLVYGAWVAVVRPVVAAVLMVVGELLNLSDVLSGFMPTPVFRLSLAFGVLAVLLGVRRCPDRLRLGRSLLVPMSLVTVFVLTQVVATVSSIDSAASVDTVRREVIDLTFALVLLVLMQLAGRPWVIAAAVVVPLAALSMLGVVNALVFHDAASFGGFDTVTTASGELITTARHAGPLDDSNFWGRHLVMALPLALALTVRACRVGRAGGMVGWAASVVALIAGVYLTQSRGTFLACAFAVTVWVLVSGRTFRRRALTILPLGLPVLLLPGVGDRLVALVGDVTSASVTYGIDPSILGRQAAQEVAWAIFRDRPVLGSGPGTYAALVPDYAGSVTTAVLEPVLAAHNLYAQFAAESGALGLLGWLVMFFGLLTMVVVSVARLQQHRPQDRTLAAAVLAGLAGYAFASVFLHLAYLRSLGVMLALAASMLAVSGPPLAAAHGQLRARTVRATAEGLSGVLVGLAVLWVLSPTEVRADQRVTALSTLQDPGAQAYALDIRSRQSFLPTLAQVMTTSIGPSGSVVADPVRGLLTVSATASDEARARTSLGRALADGTSGLMASGAVPSYTLSKVGSTDVDTHRRVSLLAVLAGLAAGLVGAAAVSRLLRVRSGPPRRVLEGAR